MAVSNLDKDNLTRLFYMINVKPDDNLLVNIKSNNTTYSKLQLISKQIEYLKYEANLVLKQHDLNIDLNSIQCNFRKSPGNYYYVYENNNQKILSMISPDEWNTFNKFICKVYFDFDYNFYICDES